MGPRSTMGPSSKGHTRVKSKPFTNWKMDSWRTDALKCSISSTEPTFCCCTGVSVRETRLLYSDRKDKMLHRAGMFLWKKKLTEPFIYGLQKDRKGNAKLTGNPKLRLLAWLICNAVNHFPFRQWLLVPCCSSVCQKLSAGKLWLAFKHKHWLLNSSMI